LKQEANILQIDKFAFAKFELVRAAADEFGVGVVLVLVDAEVAGADEFVPVFASLAVRNVFQVAGVEGSESDLSDHVVITLVGLDIDGNVDNIRVRSVCGWWSKAERNLCAFNLAVHVMLLDDTCFMLCFLCGFGFALVLSGIDSSIHVASEV
jgi:hypothetical protein